MAADFQRGAPNCAASSLAGDSDDSGDCSEGAPASEDGRSTALGDDPHSGFVNQWLTPKNAAKTAANKARPLLTTHQPTGRSR